MMTRDATGKATVHAVRISGDFALDGALTEAVYATVAPLSDFIQQEPNEGEPATEKTEAWIFFDDANIYIGADVRVGADQARGERDAARLVQHVQQRPPGGRLRHLQRPSQRLRLLGQPPGRNVRLVDHQRAAEFQLERLLAVESAGLRRRMDGRDPCSLPIDSLPGRRRCLGRQPAPHGALEERSLVPDRRCRGRGAAAVSTSSRTPRRSSASSRPASRSTSTSSRTRSAPCSPTAPHAGLQQQGRRQLRRRRQVGRNPAVRRRLHLQHRLRAGRRRRRAGEPDALLAVLPGEARLLPGGAGRLRLRRRGRRRRWRRRRAAAGGAAGAAAATT